MSIWGTRWYLATPYEVDWPDNATPVDTPVDVATVNSAPGWIRLSVGEEEVMMNPTQVRGLRDCLSERLDEADARPNASRSQ